VVVVQPRDHRRPTAVDHRADARDGLTDASDHAVADEDVAHHAVDFCVAQHQVVRRPEVVVHTPTLALVREAAVDGVQDAIKTAGVGSASPAVKIGA